MCQQRLSFVLSRALRRQRPLASYSKLKPRYAISYHTDVSRLAQYGTISTVPSDMRISMLSDRYVPSGNIRISMSSDRYVPPVPGGIIRYR
ncbi:unnamed protein product, partial [Musa hybrid cultivar]